MLADRRAVLGFALGGLGFALWLPMSLGGGLRLGTAILVARALALLAGAALLGGFGLDGAKRGLTVALGIGLAAGVANALLSVSGDVSFVNDAVPVLGWLLLAWYAVLHALEPAGSTRRLFGLRVGAAVLAFGFVGWLPFNVDPSGWGWIPGNVVGVAGTLLVARYLGPAPAHAHAPASPSTQAGKA